ncbi:50S ribosomal protein L6 [Candidatus Woesearchaeota archaeon]|nr:50S ribosomal protein L6 [Candidatus Woesearchaeota archaeon]
MKQEITIPDNVTVKQEQNTLTVKGPAGEIQRTYPTIKITTEPKRITLETKKDKRSQKRLLNTYKAHIKNMIQGAQKKYTYKLKICASHFPIQATATNNTFTVKNFTGEKKPREIRIPQNVTITIKEQNITVESSNIEIAGTTAGAIELLTRVRRKDRRVFQDGIYIVEKPCRY